MTKKRYLIGLTGKARSGKDTLGLHLIRSKGFHRMALADPLKESMAATFGIPVTEFHDEDFKDEVHPEWQLTRRAMLQQGADALRGQFGQDLYIRRWLRAYLNLADQEHVVVTDIRSDAEAQAVRDLGGSVLRLTRSVQGLEGAEAHHHTEHGVSSHLVDVDIPNEGTRLELFALIDTFLKGLK